MMFLKPVILFGLVASVCATPVPQDSSTDLAKRLAEVEEKVNSLVAKKQEVEIDFTPTYNLLETRATIKDTKCPDNGKTYTAKQISDAVKAENAKANPGKYGNNEGGKKLFDTNDQLYKASLDNVARAVFSRKDGKYTYRGLMEHDKGTGDGFHKC
ncbi:hypothetical protein P153DRAFT_432877 [Dothidotthia symphoricarpi CBS 119687]|uniref:Uncharacterized protein n=1 Tax=Dothidotthia symphoricarpi CBS 119687 TaxID=1392245 RepID=A0A6A6AAE2_9PLEO|nr:uncharacterized protein P153DRAFT_432877 [Dothidotthia symphoricarpi CBS 119687]KAF2127838.1 hypothetical protein P153DRAFT_432877 [Dothidotthia symphoricarpi CBS 119687]